jgi:hypothetical protein
MVMSDDHRERDDDENRLGSSHEPAKFVGAAGAVVRKRRE